jgi:hypothetical protein
MRTHSAPPDEHAGIFELGGNGVRANTTSQVLPTRGAPEVFFESGLNLLISPSPLILMSYPKRI